MKHFNPSPKFRQGFNGEGETKLRRDKADTNKQDQEEKGEKVYSCARDNIDLCCSATAEMIRNLATNSNKGYWTANHQ